VSALLLLGCHSETGIILAVSGSSVDELEFNVAVQQDDATFIMAQEGTGGTYDVRGRNLRAEPYEHLLRQGDEAGAPLRVRVLVLGRVGGKDRSFAITEPPQPFMPDEVVRRALTLVSLGDSASVTRQSTGCFRVWQHASEKDRRWTLAVTDDRDCDGSKPPADCKDDNPAVHPGASEICDGVDNNCDGKYAESPQPCYAADSSGVCRKGTRPCGDAAGTGLGQTCSVSGTDPQMPTAYCDAYAACAGSSDPVGCTNQKLTPLEGQCTAELDSNLNTLCGGSLALEPLNSSTTCRWDIVDDGGWSVGLSDGSSSPTATIAICRPKLLLEPQSTPGGGKLLMEFVGDQGSEVVQASVGTTSVATCGVEPFVCSVKTP